MAKLDKFIEMMAQRNAQSAVLASDQPFELLVQGQKVRGSVASGAQLMQALEEIVPEHLRAQLSQDGFFEFRHELPQGNFNVAVQNFFGKLQVTITPASPSSEYSLSPLQPTAPPLSGTGSIPKPNLEVKGSGDQDSGHDMTMQLAAAGLCGGGFIGWNAAALCQASVSTAAVSAGICGAIGAAIGLIYGLASHS